MDGVNEHYGQHCVMPGAGPKGALHDTDIKRTLIRAFVHHALPLSGSALCIAKCI